MSAYRVNQSRGGTVPPPATKLRQMRMVYIWGTLILKFPKS